MPATCAVPQGHILLGQQQPWLWPSALKQGAAVDVKFKSDEHLQTSSLEND